MFSLFFLFFTHCSLFIYQLVLIITVYLYYFRCISIKDLKTLQYFTNIKLFAFPIGIFKSFIHVFSKVSPFKTI